VLNFHSTARFFIMPSFKQSLEIGKTGESEIAKWLINRGSSILPVYEIAENQFKGPAVYSADNLSIIAPDMLIFKEGKATFIEAKHKEAFSWHRISQKWVTGIDLHHYLQYQKIEETLKVPVWIMFLHRGGKAKDSEKSPAGLFGNSLEFLAKNENHRHENWGKSGMVYWNIDSLKKLSDYPLNNPLTTGNQNATK